jgi:hypothetical protein
VVASLEAAQTDRCVNMCELDDNQREEKIQTYEKLRERRDWCGPGKSRESIGSGGMCSSELE